ncbi:hypothetical protein LZ30DRAFT_685580 [Colletotrichum cereale]|nr:hypothetical protein LZ30DRAFT_685580 [Colletotrichum cereale]
MRYIPPTVEEDARENKNEQSEKPLNDDPEHDKKRDKEQSTAELPSPGNPTKKDDEQKARHQAKEEKKKEAKAARATSAQYPRPTPKKPPFYSDAAKDDNSIKFKDALGRKFRFPYEMAKNWSDMEDLIKQAFIHIDVIGPHVQEGHYDLISPEGDIILPATWRHFVQPGWAVEMRMWPMDRPAEARPALRPFPPGMIPPGGLPGGVGTAPPKMERRNIGQGPLLSYLNGGGKAPMEKSKVPRGFARRSTLATEMVPGQSGPRHNTNRSLNLRSQLKKRITKLKRSGSPSSSSSSNDTSSDSSSTTSGRMLTRKIVVG